MSHLARIQMINEHVVTLIQMLYWVNNYDIFLRCQKPATSQKLYNVTILIALYTEEQTKILHNTAVTKYLSYHFCICFCYCISLKSQRPDNFLIISSCLKCSLQTTVAAVKLYSSPSRAKRLSNKRDLYSSHSCIEIRTYIFFPFQAIITLTLYQLLISNKN